MQKEGSHIHCRINRSYNRSYNAGTTIVTKAARRSSGYGSIPLHRRSWIQTPSWEHKNFQSLFHQQKLWRLSITCNIKLESALFSVFHAAASKRPWASLYEKCMCRTPSFIISSFRLPVVAGHISWLCFIQYISLRQYTLNVIKNATYDFCTFYQVKFISASQIWLVLRTIC